MRDALPIREDAEQASLVDHDFATQENRSRPAFDLGRKLQIAPQQAIPEIILVLITLQRGGGVISDSSESL